MATGSDSVCQELAADNSWVARDQRVMWHPFTQAQTASPPLAIVRGQGTCLYTESGKSYIDAISSWWVNLHGHSHPYIAQKIAEQASLLEHVVFAGFTHPQAITLAERLLSILPAAYSRIFYSDNGSTSVEVALKMALQKKGGGKLLSFTGAYHGDTFGAMAASGKTHYNRPFWPYLFEVKSIMPPTPGCEEASWRQFEEAVMDPDCTAFIFEPLIQGAAGMVVHSAEVLAQMVALCKERGIISIADEVMTGFGRTGPLFATTGRGIIPDLICLSKGITGGFLPLGVTIAQEEIFKAFLSDDPQAAFLHGHSYTANPLACAAANASLDLLLTEKCGSQRKMIEEEHKLFIETVKGHPSIARISLLGTILALEYQTERGSYYHPIKERLAHFFLQRGIIVRPLGNLLYIFPPYCITREELIHIYTTILMSLEEKW